MNKKIDETANLLMLRYFESKSLVGHNIDSFDKFIEKGMQRVIDEVKEIKPDILPERVKDLKIEFGKLWLGQPVVQEADGTRRKILPIEARLRNVTYEAPIMLEMRMIRDSVETEKRDVQVGAIPVMIKSKYCYLDKMSKEELIKIGEDPSDPGGYFIINGTERVIVVIEDLAPNKLFVQEKKIGTYPFVGKIFSEDGRYRIPHSFEKAKDNIIYISFTRIKKIPFVVLMKAFGIVKDSDIVKAISTNNRIQSDIYINLLEASEINTQEKALNEIGKKLGVTHSDERRIQRAEDMIDKFFLPHIGGDKESRKAKAYFLGRAIKKLLFVSYGIINEDDKDHYSNKRLRLPGDMLESLFRFSFRMLAGDMKYNFERLVKRGRIPSLTSVTRSHLLTSRVKSALATGEWVGNRHGVSQHLDRNNFYATISHLRRVVSLLTSSRENFEARDLHPTHWGKLCTSETPEGPSVGLRKNLAVCCEISTESEIDDDELIKNFKKNGLEVIK